jgi:hypothetical protein
VFSFSFSFVSFVSLVVIDSDLLGGYTSRPRFMR